MALSIERIDLWNAFERYRQEIESALVAAGHACPEGENWRVGVIQDAGGILRVELVGVSARERGMCGSDWACDRGANGVAVYAKTIIPLDGTAGAEDWLANIRESISRLLRIR